MTALVEYAVAVDAYLGQAALSAASRRVYRISLAGWAWPLIGQPIPAGEAARRGAAVVPLGLLDDPGTPGRLAEAIAVRATGSDARTVTVNCRHCAAPSAGGRTSAGSGPIRRQGCGTGRRMSSRRR